MKLLLTETNQEFEAEIIKLNETDYKHIDKSKQFYFNWSLEKEYDVYKIVKFGIKKNRKIHGLISLTDRSDEYRIHINLIENSLENSLENKGRNKKIERVAGCLIAFAVQIAFEKGYYGFTSLTPKTELINLYQEKHGFSQFGRQLAVEGKEAIALIQKYL